MEADLVLLGPGSWFTSVLPHLLVPELREALVSTQARRVVVLNLAPQPGETAGFSPEQHLDVLSQHAPELRVDAVLADGRTVPVPQRLRRSAEALGARAILAPVGEQDGTPRHNPAALAEAVRGVLAGVAGIERPDGSPDERPDSGPNTSPGDALRPQETQQQHQVSAFGSGREENERWR
jgi:uncharacterized cofD-like protein